MHQRFFWDWVWVLGVGVGRCIAGLLDSQPVEIGKRGVYEIGMSGVA